jgi:thymidylate synthase
MNNYVELIRDILWYGEQRNDRTGVGTMSIFDAKLTFDLRKRFPLVTIKETRWQLAFLEMLWFLRGETNTEWLNKHGCKLWNAWADGNGNLGPVYGFNWRRWGAKPDNIPQPNPKLSEGFDQVQALIQGLHENPHGRRHIVTAWNVAEIPSMALPPCHWAHQCYVTNLGELDLKVFIRSSDVALGLPFNIAQYALLAHLYARAAGLTARRLIVDIGDAHLYLNHVDAMREAITTRQLRFDNEQGARTKLVFNTENTDIDGYKPEDFTITGYNFYPHIPLPVAV